MCSCVLYSRNFMLRSFECSSLCFRERSCKGNCHSTAKYNPDIAGGTLIRRSWSNVHSNGIEDWHFLGGWWCSHVSCMGKVLQKYERESRCTNIYQVIQVKRKRDCFFLVYSIHIDVVRRLEQTLCFPFQTTVVRVVRKVQYTCTSIRILSIAKSVFTSMSHQFCCTQWRWVDDGESSHLSACCRLL
jgi:hypothetical protein